MATVDSPQKAAQPVALPGLARALMSVDKLNQKTAEEIYKKSVSGRSSFIAELIGANVITSTDLAHTLSSIFGAPLLDVQALDRERLPHDLLDLKLCQAYRVVVLSKRNNRLIVATADPTNQEAAEKITFTTQMGVDWIIAEYDKLIQLVDAAAKSSNEALDSIVSSGVPDAISSVMASSSAMDDITMYISLRPTLSEMRPERKMKAM